MTFLDKLFSFEGRLRRRDYWLLGIMLAVIQLVVLLTAINLAGGDFASMAKFNAHIWSPSAAVVILIQLAFLWPYMALAVKRRHDRDASGMLYLVIQGGLIVLGFVPYNLIGLSGTAGTIVTGLIGLIQIGVGLWFLIVIGFLDGTQGPNRYGPSPKGLNPVDGVFD